MDNKLKLLITVYDEYGSGGLLKVAIKFPYDMIPYDLLDFPESFMEPNNLAFLGSLLPGFIATRGPIVDVARIMDVLELPMDYSKYE